MPSLGGRRIQHERYVPRTSRALLSRAPEATILIRDLSSTSPDGAGRRRPSATSRSSTRASARSSTPTPRSSATASRRASRRSVVVSARKIDLLRAELGDVAERVCFADMADVGSNPGAIISAWDDFVSRPLRRGPARARHRRADLARAQPPTSWPSATTTRRCSTSRSPTRRASGCVCPYDVDALDPRGRRARARARTRSSGEDGAERHSRRLPRATPLAAAVRRGARRAAGRRLRGRVRRRLARPPCARSSASSRSTRASPATRRDDLLLAVNELATNSVRHGGGEGVLRAWHDGDSLVCEVSDRGRIERAAGRAHAPAGRGAQRLRAVAGQPGLRPGAGARRPTAGSVVRMRMRRALSAASCPAAWIWDWPAAPAWSPERRAASAWRPRSCSRPRARGCCWSRAGRRGCARRSRRAAASSGAWPRWRST